MSYVRNLIISGGSLKKKLSWAGERERFTAVINICVYLTENRNSVYYMKRLIIIINIIVIIIIIIISTTIILIIKVNDICICR